MADSNATLLDISGKLTADLDVWAPILVTKADIDREVERLSSIPYPVNGRRAVAVVHPAARAPGLGFAPGTSVTIHVLNPGEETDPMRSNATQVEVCISGSGVVMVEGNEGLEPVKWDVWNIPSMKTYTYRATGEQPFVYLSYSNSPLLEKLGVYHVEFNPAVTAVKPDMNASTEPRRRDTAPNFQISTGAWLRGYEYLVDIDVVENPAMLWSWSEVEPRLEEIGRDRPVGMLLLYNPATERRNGTTANFFTTMTQLRVGAKRPSSTRGHRHISSAINYHMRGQGYSIVDGQRVDWGPGDLLLSAPGWSEHAHYPSEDEMVVFTVQDHPLHIGMESLLWQEDMSGPILNLGSQKGFNMTAPRS